MTRMAANHADGMLFGSVLLYPIVAAHTAFSAGARWTTPLFFVVGLAIGLFLVTTSRFALYSVIEAFMSSRMAQSENRWYGWIIGAPVMLAYFLFPIAITCAGLYIVYHGSLWAVGLISP